MPNGCTTDPPFSSGTPITRFDVRVAGVIVCVAGNVGVPNVPSSKCPSG
jgi:hypothetical protein